MWLYQLEAQSLCSVISDTTDIEDETKNEDAQSAYDVEQITNENHINEVTESN